MVVTGTGTDTFVTGSHPPYITLLARSATQIQDHSITNHAMYGRDGQQAVDALQAESIQTLFTAVLQSSQTALLLSWARQHIHHPYPTTLEKIDLVQLVGATIQQVSDWFANFRKRHWERELSARVNTAAVSSTDDYSTLPRVRNRLP